MRGFLKIFSKFGFLILLVFLFELVFEEIGLRILYVLIENILFALAVICPLYFISRKNLFKYYLIFAYLIFSFSLYLETVYYYLFKSFFSSSAIFIAMESNTNEIKEFTSSYLDARIIVLTVLFLIVTIISIIFIRRECYKALLTSKKHKLRILAALVAILIFLKVSTLISFNLPYLVIKSSIEYYLDSKKFSDYRINKNGAFKNVSRESNISKQEVYIIIIGESTSRSHMGIYNYYRNTTPLLEEIKNEMLIYNNVISPHTYTIASLTKGLTLGNFENTEIKYKGSIIQLLNQANFKTYWISNQRPIGVFDTQVTKIGLGADKSIFLNSKHTNETTNFDQGLIDQLKKVFLEEGDKKVIFLQMIGAHIDYSKRYPKEYNHFKNTPRTKFNNKEVFKKINSYDNAIRYSDYVIREVIELTKKLSVSSFVFYFSDHGEEVYDDIDFFGHSADQIITRNIYEIPMFVWLSEDFKRHKDISINKEVKYMIDDIFHSIADLCQVRSTEVDSTRSIFSEHFKERKRIIRDTIDYDTFFK